LQRLDWAIITKVGKERSGAESVRSLLLTRYDEVLEGTSPAGKKIGLNVNGCRITDVSDPNLGFLEEDDILAINGKTVGDKGTCDPELLGELAQEAKASGKPITLTVLRKAPTPFTNFDNKLKEAYGQLDGDLPDLEDVQGLLGEAKVLATSGASSPSAADSILPKLRVVIDKLIKDLTPLAAACK
jgi:hypothetical protein